MPKRFLLMYISFNSGHHSASCSIEKALKELQGDCEVLNINGFNYIAPIFERIIDRTYMSVIKNAPEVWDYLYDNPKIVKHAQALRDLIHRFNTGKLKTLLEDFKPDAIACTQAFPCGMVADYKRTEGINMPLVGVLTDYAPHSYWIFNNVDAYVVPSEETGARLVANGILGHKIKPFGIPINPKFNRKVNRGEILKKFTLLENIPTVLIMGGGQGLGPLDKIITTLDKSKFPFQILVITGVNKKLFNYLSKRKRSCRKRVEIFPFIDYVDELMEISDVIITKPGGLTTAEALAKSLPMIIVNPLPGQEAMNTSFLLKEGVAVKAENEQDVKVFLEEMLYNPEKLSEMRERAKVYSKPDSALKTAKLLMEFAS